VNAYHLLHPPHLRRLHPRASAWLLAACLLPIIPAHTTVVHEAYSPYHHIRVIDQRGIRILSFNGSQETRMSLRNPLTGHFEYVEFFHLPWIWNPNIERVLTIGLGGGSTQRSFQHYHPNLHIDTAEIDPEVIRIAQRFFNVLPSPTHQIHNQDGRVFLRRTEHTYGAILVDAYTTGRYGPAIPPHLATKEFFQIAFEKLDDDGVLMFNAIGSLAGHRADMIGALYNTLKSVFPQVYLFPARESINVVFLATKSSEPYNAQRLLYEGKIRIREGKARLPTFIQRLTSFVPAPPPAAAVSPILTDDYAPIERLLGASPQSPIHSP
jgi:spermidine synthase